MKVHLIKRQTVEEFSLRYPMSTTSFALWLEKLKHADWEKPGDIKMTYNSADLLGGGSNRVVFDIAGNRYRMICKYVFGETQIHLFVYWIGTHADYTILCRHNKQFTISVD
jgi:mRNA interferase HigB